MGFENKIEFKDGIEMINSCKIIRKIKKAKTRIIDINKL